MPVNSISAFKGIRPTTEPLYAGKISPFAKPPISKLTGASLSYLACKGIELSDPVFSIKNREELIRSLEKIYPIFERFVEFIEAHTFRFDDTKEYTLNTQWRSLCLNLELYSRYTLDETHEWTKAFKELKDRVANPTCKCKSSKMQYITPPTPEIPPSERSCTLL